MDSKFAAAIAVKGHVAIADGAIGSAQLPPLTRLVGHIDRIDLPVKDGEFTLWGGGLRICDRHRPGAKPLLTPHEADLPLAEVKHDAGLTGRLPHRQLSRLCSKAWEDGPRQQASQHHRRQ